MGSASMASPDFVVTFTFFLLLLYLAFHSSEATHPECELSTIYCENEKLMIKSQIGKYEIKSLSEDNNNILVHDIQLSESLIWHDCSGLFNLQDPIFPPFFHFETRNHTFLKCNKLYTPPPPGLDSPDIHRYPHCNDSDLFYSNKSEHGLPPEDQLASFGCSKFDYPVLPPVDGNWDLLVPVLERGFFLELNYSSECHDDCQATCRREWNGALNKCAGGKKKLGLNLIGIGGGKFSTPKNRDKMKMGPILGIAFGALGVGILLTSLIYFCCPRPRNRRFSGVAKSKNLSPSSIPLSANTNFNSSSKMDLEKGGSTYYGVHIFSYHELVEATSNFDSSRELGDGGFGIVYYGKLRDGRVVAVKRLYENTFKHVVQFMNEVEILTQLRHQNLVTLYGCTSRHSRELLLVYEYIPNGTVADHLHGDRAEPGSLTWSIRMSIAIETASALSYLHASEIIHRDVKTNNILLDNNFCVKVADFGLSRLFPLDVTHVSTAPQGTPGYVDPEYHECYQLTNKSDVYSFGVVLIELISSMPAVDINRHRHEINLADLAMNKIQNGALHELIDSCLGFESDYGVRMMTTLVAELAFRCLQLDKEMRPSMDEVLEILRGIESEDYNVEKDDVVIVPADDMELLKSFPPHLSPDSVSDKLVSASTTPSVSG